MALKGFIKNMDGTALLPVTRGELVKDQNGLCAFFSNEFLAEAASAGSNGHPGLMTASEKALLSGSGTNGLKDLYAQLQAIDNHLKVTGTTIPLSTKELNIVSSDSGIAAKLTETTTNKYELEFVLSDTLENKTLSNVVVPSVGDSDVAVVNKQYVDSKFNNSMNVATGALKFIGPVKQASDLAPYMNNPDAIGAYFKATDVINIAAGHDYLGTGFTTKIGDTLIIAEKSGSIRIVHIPSGDDNDTILYLGNTALIGKHTLSAATPLSITKSNNIINLGITPASDKTDGYLTASDYKTFKEASQKEITYNNSVEDGIQIGALNEIPITIPKLTLTTKETVNGVIQYDGHSDNQIIVTGSGIAVGVDSNSLTLTPNIANTSLNYLSVKDGEIHLNVWSAEGTNQSDPNSLITLGAFASGVVNHVEFTPLGDQTEWTLTDKEIENLT